MLFAACMAFVLLFTMYCSMVLIMTEHDQVSVRVASVLALIAALFLFFRRDTFLPFLGQCALPPSIFQTTSSPPNSNVETDIMIDAPDNTKVIYWGASPENGSNRIIENPIKAYGDYNNMGIAVVRRGHAKIRFFCPVKYEVPWGKTLDRHIHYRVINETGMLGSVKTEYVTC